ncbi:MAG: hypothetical protein ACRCR2_02545 [Fusobacteriaceae bacterium]
MSEETKVEKILVQVKPNNDAAQLEAMLTEFEAHGLKLEGNGIISVPKLFTHITDKEELLFVFPNRQDFMVALEKDEYVILTQ